MLYKNPSGFGVNDGPIGHACAWAAAGHSQNSECGGTKTNAEYSGMSAIGGNTAGTIRSAGAAAACGTRM